MDALRVFSLAIGVIGLIGGTGGLVAFFQKGRGDSIIAYQGNELSLRDATIARQKEELAGLTAERNTLKQQNVTLTGLAQGSPELVELTKQIRLLTKIVREKIR